MAGIDGGSLAKRLMESNDGLGVFGWLVRADRGEVKGGGVDFEVSRILLGVIPRDIIIKYEQLMYLLIWDHEWCWTDCGLE
ncbi:hypothetical protein Tco_0123132 [Tanacetum coccineum]